MIKCVTCDEVIKTKRYLRHPYNKTRKRFERVECLKCIGIRKRNTRLHKEHVCDLCGERKQSRRAMINHIETHLELNCDVCKSVQKTKVALRNHVRTHFENFVCELCGQKFEKPSQFIQHAIVHDPEKLEQKKQKRDAEKIVGGFPCNFCPAKFDRESTLKAHEAGLHKGGKVEERFRCEVCGKGLKIFLY